LETHSEIPSVERTDTAGRKSPAKKPRKGGIKVEGGLPGPNPEKARDTWREAASETEVAPATGDVEAAAKRAAFTVVNGEPAVKPEGELLTHIPGIGNPVLIEPPREPAEVSVDPVEVAPENTKPTDAADPAADLKEEAWHDFSTAVELLSDLPAFMKGGPVKFADPLAAVIDGCPSSAEFNLHRSKIHEAAKVLDALVKITRRIPKAKQWGAS
jgi:hypothetical protein